MSKLPVFGAGKYENIVANLGSTFSYPSYVYIRDEKKLGFVDKDGSLNLIVGDNEPQIVKLDALPDISEGKKNVLYIVGEVVHLFNGETFVPINSMDSAELEALTERVSALETAMTDKVSSAEVDAKVEAKVDEVIDEKVSASVDNSEKITALETSNQELTAKVSELEEAIAALEENSAPAFIELE